MTTTWNPSDKGAAVTLSNGNLTAAYGSGTGAARATTSKSSGKWYWECTYGGNPDNGQLGISDGSANVSTFADSTHSNVYYAGTGGFYGSGTAYGATYTAGDIIGVALDMDNGKLFFAKNNTWQNSGDPVAGTNAAKTGLSGSWFPSCFLGVGSANAASYTVNFGATALTYTAPTGYSTIDSNAVFGTMPLTEAQDTSAMTGTQVTPTGTMALTEAQDTSAMTGTQVTPTGTMALTEAADTFTGTGNSTFAATSWNPLDKGSTVTLSNGNLTINYTSGADASVRAIESKSTGKWYWEYTATTNALNTAPGIGNASASINAYFYNSANGWTYYANGNKYTSNGGVAYGSAYTDGDIIGTALDMSSGKVWWSKNGVWQASGDPVAGTNAAYTGLTGSIFPMAAVNVQGSTVAAASTTNFGATAFTYTPPTGYSGVVSSTVTGTMAPTDTQDTTSQTGTVVASTGSMDLTEAQDTSTIGATVLGVTYAVTWNPADKGTNVALSSGNLIAAFNSGIFSNETVRATLGRSTGKYYFEVVHSGGVDYRLSGVATSVPSTSTGFVSSTEGFGYLGTDGKFYTNNAGTTYGNTFNTEVIGVAVDLDAHKLWFSKSGVWQNSGDPTAGTNPATSSLTSGVIYPAAQGNNASQNPTSTANFGGSAFTYTIPIGGYTAWAVDNYVSVSIAATEASDTSSMVGSQSASGSLIVTEAADVFTGTGFSTDPTQTLFVAVGNSGKITTSPDGTTWSPQFSGVTEKLMSVAQGGSGGTWIAVGYGGRILRSLNGSSWSAVASGTTTNLEGVSFGNGIWIAVGWSGKILTSPDGITWTSRTSGTTVQLSGINYNTGSAGAVWIAMGGSGVYRTSTDNGVTWSNSNSPLSPVTTLQEVAWSSGLSEWVAVGVNGASNKIYTSLDGGNWTAQATPNATQTPYCVTWGSPYWVVGEASGKVATSTNGTTWTQRAAIGTMSAIYGLAFADGVYVAVGYNVSSSRCFTTTDPTSTWTQRTTGEGAVSLNGIYAGAILTPTIPNTYGILQATENTDTFTGTGNSDQTGAGIVVNFNITEPQDVFSGSTGSTTVSGLLAVTENQDVVSFTQGGSSAVSIQLLPATFNLIVTYGAFLFNGGTLKVYTGNQPLDPTSVPSGTLLASITLPDPAFVEATNGECIKTGDWSGAATDTGVAGWFRLTSSDGLNSIDGSVSTSLGTGDIIASTINFAIGDPVEVTSATFAFTLLNQ